MSEGAIRIRNVGFATALLFLFGAALFGLDDARVPGQRHRVTRTRPDSDHALDVTHELHYFTSQWFHSGSGALVIERSVVPDSGAARVVDAPLSPGVEPPRAQSGLAVAALVDTPPGCFRPSSFSRGPPVPFIR